MQKKGRPGTPRENIEMQGCLTIVRPSRCAPWALLRMRQRFDGIKKIAHPEGPRSGRLEGRKELVQLIFKGVTASNPNWVGP
jgi:hypothetical protein